MESPDVVDKYKTAAQIANEALAAVNLLTFAGTPIYRICELIDKRMEKAAGNVYNKARTESGEKLEKGVSFPTCISVNNCAAHFSPAAEEEGGVLAEGDTYTVHLAAHIDGYSAMAAASGVVRAGKDAPVATADGPAADAMVAAWTAAQAALRVMRPGKGNYEVTDVIESVAKDFGVEAMEGVLSHNVKRFVVDGNKVIMNRRDPEGASRVDDWEFEENEVYALDVVMSTGEGKAKEKDAKATVYKRKVDVDYQLKMKSSRAVFSEINKRYPTFAFNMRSLEDAKRARLGLTEMLNHDLVVPYPVLFEKDGAIVARVSATVLVLPSQTLPITAINAPAAKSEKEVTDQAIKDLLAIDISSKKKKKKKSKAVPAADAMET